LLADCPFRLWRDLTRLDHGKPAFEADDTVAALAASDIDNQFPTGIPGIPAKISNELLAPHAAAVPLEGTHENVRMSTEIRTKKCEVLV
jgi:hypothetical protein